MAREILFRGKRTDNGEWAEGELIHAVPSGIPGIRIPSRTALLIYSVIPETVGQFTGLTGRNGKRIFEGDIVQWPGRKEVGLVQYGEFNCSCCEGVFGWHFGTEDIREHDSYEVIGNIHDSPELLNGTES